MSPGFGTLAVIVLAGLLGPLLGLSRRWFVPIVIGELLAGILVGPDVLKAVDPANPTISFLGEIGFAMLMLTVGMHLPLRERRLAESLSTGALLTLIVATLAVPAGIVAAAIAGGGHAAIYVVVLASGSAAVLLPAIQESGLDTPAVLTVMAQVTIADILTIISIPIVLQPQRTSHALLGGAAVAGAVLLLVLAGRAVGSEGWIQHARDFSKHRHWALDLRVSLLVLFLLAFLANKSGTSVLIAGFGAGVMVAVFEGPKRLSTQVRGIADGFFVPLYFVVLGARLDLGGLLEHPALLALTGALAAMNVLIRLLAFALMRRDAAQALAASAQLGVPAAVATLGLSEHILSAAVATAVVAAALPSLAAATFGVDLLAARARRGGDAGGQPGATPATPAGIAQAPQAG